LRNPNNMSWAGYPEFMGGGGGRADKNTEFYAENMKGRSRLGEREVQMDRIEMGVKEIEREVVDWIQLAQNRIQCLSL
jgi:hypothetical protein